MSAKPVGWTRYRARLIGFYIIIVTIVIIFSNSLSLSMCPRVRCDILLLLLLLLRPCAATVTGRRAHNAKYKPVRNEINKRREISSGPVIGSRTEMSLLARPLLEKKKKKTRLLRFRLPRSYYIHSPTRPTPSVPRRPRPTRTRPSPTSRP